MAAEGTFLVSVWVIPGTKVEWHTRKIDVRLIIKKFTDSQFGFSNLFNHSQATILASYTRVDNSTNETICNLSNNKYTFDELELDAEMKAVKAVEVYWTVSVKVYHKEKINKKVEKFYLFPISYDSRHSAAKFCDDILSTKDVSDNIRSPVLEVKDARSSRFVSFTNDIVMGWGKAPNNIVKEIYCRSSHSSYSDLDLLDIVAKIKLPQHVPPPRIKSETANLQFFAKLTEVEDAKFRDTVNRYSELLGKAAYFGMFCGFEYLEWIQTCFPAVRDDRNETQRRTICDPILYSVAKISHWCSYEELEVWPSGVFPQNAAGHGPVDYVLMGESQLLVKGKIIPNRKRRVREEGDDDEIGGDGDEDNEGEEEYPTIMTVEKKTTKTLPKSFAQLVGQALDSMLEGAFSKDSRVSDKSVMVGERKRYCVLSTGQRYYFFRVEYETEESTPPSVTFLAMYRFRYFSNERDSNLEMRKSICKNEYRNVVAAMLVCIFDGKEDEDLKGRLEQLATEYQQKTKLQ
jgi:hypothetical protein